MHGWHNRLAPLPDEGLSSSWLAFAAFDAFRSIAHSAEEGERDDTRWTGWSVLMICPSSSMLPQGTRGCVTRRRLIYPYVYVDHRSCHADPMLVHRKQRESHIQPPRAWQESARWTGESLQTASCTGDLRCHASIVDACQTLCAASADAKMNKADAALDRGNTGCVT